MPSPSFNSTLAHLQALHPGALMLDAHAVAATLGIAYKTLNNAGDSFPVRPVKFGRRKYYRVIDIAAYVDDALGLDVVQEPAHVASSVSEASPASRRPGRPRKYSESARSQAAKRGEARK
jgi:hypothetical protein